MNEPEPVHPPLTLEDALREIERLRHELREAKDRSDRYYRRLVELLPPLPSEEEAELAEALAGERFSTEQVFAELAKEFPGEWWPK